MSEKRTGAGRTADADEERKRAELQRRVEEARGRVAETVAEIKSTVTQQYEGVKETVETVKGGFGEVLDWRTEFERNPLVWGAGAVSVGILVGFGIARVLDEEDEKPRRGKRSASTSERLVAELGGFADVVLPTISSKVKELFGLDLDAYLRAAREPRPARRLPAKKRATKKGAAKKRHAATKKRTTAGRSPSKSGARKR